MCGIAGRFHPEHLPLDHQWHKITDSLLSHRGPDDSGHYQDDYCELVHRRLALVDLSPTGHQPMPNENGSIYVIFNGEIYNHRDLRSNLESQGHNFRGTSDTEVLVHLYEAYGPQMVKQLRGMFAFAIYDRPRRQLFLTRDRFGIKPLYFAVHNQQWIFASEIKAILALSDFNPSVDHQACYDYLGLGYIPEPLTGFREIQALSAGTTLIINTSGSQIDHYYQIQTQPDLNLRLDNAVELVSESLCRAVKRQAIADVPVAALLSGGIDSSLIVAAYSQTIKESPTTFNVRFPDKDYDETVIANAVSNYYQTRHYTIEADQWTITSETVLKLLRHFDQPFADSSLIPTYQVSKGIRERGIICALSGDGGDEAFGGYARFWRANKLVQLMKLPNWLQVATNLTGSYVSKWTRNWGRQLAKATQLAQAGRIDSSILIAGLSNYLSEQQKQDLVLLAAREELQPIYRHFNGYHPPGVSELEELSLRMTEKLFAVGLKSDMLRKVDMMSMLAGIEVRVPLLDENVVAMGLTLPHRLKTDGHNGKLVLRALALQWLPQQVANHPKHGFGIPLDIMVDDRFHQMLRDLLLSSGARVHTFLNVHLIQQWLELFKQSRQGAWVGTISRDGLYQRIFILLALELWLREHNLSW